MHSTAQPAAKSEKKTCDGNQVCRLSVLGAVHKCIYRYILRTAWYIRRYGQASKAGLAAPKRPQPRVDFIDIAASSSVQSSSVGTAKWEACFLALAKHVRDSGSRVTSQKQWDKRDPAHHVLGRSHVEAGCRGWFIQLHHPRVLHRPLHRQVKFFKGTEENQGVNNVIRASMAAFVFRQSPILWTHNTCEEELGTGIPTVLQGNIVAILLNAVRKWRDHNNGILHTAMQ